MFHISIPLSLYQVQENFNILLYEYLHDCQLYDGKQDTGSAPVKYYIIRKPKIQYGSDRPAQEYSASGENGLTALTVMQIRYLLRKIEIPGNSINSGG